MSSYVVLKKQLFESEGYSIVPIRMEDRYDIMKWRNEQIYHLRQSEPLTKEIQDWYFDTVVADLFDQKQPKQILFSFLKGDVCIGYGGLVHINWIDKNAEISFIMDTQLEKEQFEFHWVTYLCLLEIVAFEELSLHKIFTYAFDLRPRLYTALLKSDYVKEAILKKHVFFESKYIDVVIHSKHNEKILLRIARFEDTESTFSWANDKSIRKFSYNQKEISITDHTSWFQNKIVSAQCEYYVLESKGNLIGSIRFDIESNILSAKISYLVDNNFTGKGYGTFLLQKGINKLLQERKEVISICGFVFKNNIASIRIFQKLGFVITSENENEFKFELLIK